MKLVADITNAVLHGLQSSALETAADVAKAYEAKFGPALTVTFGVVYHEAPYGPWWVAVVTAGKEVRYIANDDAPAAADDRPAP